MSHPADDPGPGTPRRRRVPRRPKGRVTLAEYLAFEERHPERHEYVGGYVYAMSGARLAHGRIVGNVYVQLRRFQGAGPCAAYSVGSKVRIGDDVYCPDAFVVCGPQDDDALMARDPCLVVEVLSPSTARVDRTQKLASYQAAPSLRAYLIVSRHERRVVRHWRASAGSAWRTDEHTDGAVPLPCPAGGSLALDEAYAGVTFRLRRLREGPAATAPA